MIKPPKSIPIFLNPKLLNLNLTLTLSAEVGPEEVLLLDTQLLGGDSRRASKTSQSPIAIEFRVQGLVALTPTAMGIQLQAVYYGYVAGLGQTVLGTGKAMMFVKTGHIQSMKIRGSSNPH